MWLLVIFTIAITSIALLVSAKTLPGVFVDYVISLSYVIETYIYTIIMSQFFVLQNITKTRFRALNGVFW